MSRAQVLLCLLGLVAPCSGCCRRCVAPCRPPISRSEASARAALPHSIVRERDGATMVLVRGGVFEQGAVEIDTVALDDEKPQHQVKVADFYVDVAEVTRAQFARFVAATGYVTEIEQNGEGMTIGDPATPASSRYPAGQTWRFVAPGMSTDDPTLPRLPVTVVSWNDAMAFARWVGASLPHESQMEYLLRRGHAGQTYPWGNELPPPPGAGNFADEELAVALPDRKLILFADYHDGHGRAAPVASYPADPFGLFDVSGNVCEWCLDPFVMYGSTLGPEEVPSGLLRGGSFFDHTQRVRCSWRTQAGRSGGREWWGFRCAIPATRERVNDMLRPEPK